MMAKDAPSPVSSPRGYLLQMAAFLVVVTLVASVLHRELTAAFLASPGINGIVLCVLALGILLAFRDVMRLFPEVGWANAVLAGRPDAEKPPRRLPRLLAPLASFLGEKPFATAVSPTGLRLRLEPVANRLDESRDLRRYLCGLPIFLGLLGTFWGLVATLGAIGETIGSMQAGTDTARLFEDLKAGVAAPIAGMSLAFASSLFGLAGSLVLGFLDLRAGAAQARFLAELEDAVTAAAQRSSGPLAGLDSLPPDLRASLEKIAASADHSHARATMVAVADLADGVQKLVGQMRSEQQLIREWVEAQAVEGRETRAALDRLAEREKEPAE